MIFDPQIVAHAIAFVNALQANLPAHIHAMRFEHGQQFFTAVRALMEGAA